MSKIYFISGLGADKRAFEKTQEINGYQYVFIDWIPNLPNESFKSYVSRLIKDYDIKENDVVLGLSFGGLAAIEIAKQTPIEKAILLSSFKDKQGLKTHLQFLLSLRLYNLIPNFKLKFFDRQAVKGFGNVSNEVKEGLMEMMKDTDPKLIKWSLKQIRKSNYINTSSFKLINILGTKDELVRKWELKEDNYFIKNAGHLMVYENADEVNKILFTILSKTH